MNVHENTLESPAYHTELQIVEHTRKNLLIFLLTSEDFSKSLPASPISTTANTYHCSEFSCLQLFDYYVLANFLSHFIFSMEIYIKKETDKPTTTLRIYKDILTGIQKCHS